MRSLTRLLAPLSVAAACAVAAPAAHAVLPDSSKHFGVDGEGVLVDITDTAPTANTVRLTVTPDDAADLDSTKVFLGGTATALPYDAVDIDGVHQADHGQNPADPDDAMCSLYGGDLIASDPEIVVDPDGEFFTVDLPKGEVVSFESIGVLAAVDDVTTGDDCSFEGVAGLEVDYGGDHEVIEGFDWVDPPAFEVAASAGRGVVELVFDQEWGTDYDIYRVVGGVREDVPFSANQGGDGNDVHVVLTESDLHEQIAPGTAYTFQVEAIRRFWVGSDDEYTYRTFGAEVTATTDSFQTLQIGSAPPATTTDRNAQFTWSITNNPAGDAPFCILDMHPEAQSSEGEIPCTTTGVSIAGLAVGTHTLNVWPAYGEGYVHTWTVTAVPAATPVAPIVVPVVKKDPDGDGITNTWLIGGKPAPAPATPKASVVDGNVKLKLKAAPKGAKKIRVYRADGKGGYKLVKTLAPKSRTFTDKKVKPGHSYKYKTVAVNAKGQQGKASKAAKATVKKRP